MDAEKTFLGHPILTSIVNTTQILKNCCNQCCLVYQFPGLSSAPNGFGTRRPTDSPPRLSSTEVSLQSRLFTESIQSERFFYLELHNSLTDHLFSPVTCLWLMKINVVMTIIINHQSLNVQYIVLCITDTRHGI